MPDRDATYPNSLDWLRANARRFYFTDEQIISAAVPSYPIDNFDHHCGVYFLMRDKQIIYVGQTLTIGRRISEHLRMPDSVAWVETPRIWKEAIEAYYINRILPEKNLKIPGLGQYTAIVEELIG